MDKGQLKKNLKDGNQWLHVFYVVLFLILSPIGALLFVVTTALQAGFHLITGAANDNLLQFARSLRVYIAQMIAFCTYDSREKPFPFSPWPQADPSTTPYADAPPPRTEDVVVADQDSTAAGSVDVTEVAGAENNTDSGAADGTGEEASPQVTEPKR